MILDPLLHNYSVHNINDLPLHVGLDPSGKAYRLDLGDDRLPHLLIAGGTGSGKTIFLYSVVLSLVAAHTERTLEMVIIDPKQTDFTRFGSLPVFRAILQIRKLQMNSSRTSRQIPVADGVDISLADFRCVRRAEPPPCWNASVSESNALRTSMTLNVSSDMVPNVQRIE